MVSEHKIFTLFKHLMVAGGYTKFISQGLNDKYLPVWLSEAGYNTYYTGKLMNGHSTTTWNKPLPAGWNGTDCKFIDDPSLEHAPLIRDSPR